MTPLSSDQIRTKHSKDPEPEVIQGAAKVAYRVQIESTGELPGKEDVLKAIGAALTTGDHHVNVREVDVD